MSILKNFEFSKNIDLFLCCHNQHMGCQQNFEIFMSLKFWVFSNSWELLSFIDKACDSKFSSFSLYLLLYQFYVFLNLDNAWSQHTFALISEMVRPCSISTGAPHCTLPFRVHGQFAKWNAMTFPWVFQVEFIIFQVLLGGNAERWIKLEGFGGNF